MITIITQVFLFDSSDLNADINLFRRDLLCTSLVSCIKCLANNCMYCNHCFIHLETKTQHDVFQREFCESISFSEFLDFKSINVWAEARSVHVDFLITTAMIPRRLTRTTTAAITT